MFWKCGKGGKGAETPQFSFPVPPPFPPSPVADLRPCEVDGEIAVFHRWVDDDTAHLHFEAFYRSKEQDDIWQRWKETGLVPPGCRVTVAREAFALVEYPDGSVGKVKPELVTFLDRYNVD